MDRWSGRVAVVTGASSGIGAAITQELVKRGLKVVGLARRVEKIEELALNLKKEAGKLYPVKCDVTQESELKSAFNWIEASLGGLDIIVNNAGCVPHNTLTDGPVESWKSIMDLNVLALSVCTKEAIQSMKKKGVDDGHIVHISSLSGHIIPPHALPIYMYSASKHAVQVLTEGLRRELVQQKSKIRITTISPSVVSTEMTPPEFLEQVPHLQPQDIADAVVYALGTPSHVQVHDITIRPLWDSY